MSETKISFFIHRSRRLVVIYGIFTLATLAVVMFVSINLWLRLLAGVIILISAIHAYLFQILRKLPNAIIKLSPLTEGRWLLETRSGKQIEAILPGHNCWTSSFMLVLGFKSNRGLRNPKIVIYQDAVPSGSFRRLRIALNNNIK